MLIHAKHKTGAEIFEETPLFEVKLTDLESKTYTFSVSEDWEYVKFYPREGSFYHYKIVENKWVRHQ